MVKTKRSKVNVDLCVVVFRTGSWLFRM